MNKKAPLIATGALIIFSVVAGWFLYQEQKQDDELLERVYQTLEGLESYSQTVETKAVLGDRLLLVSGVYHNNRKEGVFASFATTTLSLPDGNSYSFSLSNIATNDEVIVRIRTNDEALRTTIPSGDGWRRFPNTSIPEEFRDIAIPGPILDNLTLFEKRGAYLSLNKRHGEDGTFGEGLRLFEFTLRTNAIPEAGPVRAISDRLGDTGSIRAWIRDETGTIEALVFSHEPYVSTTTISNIDNPPLLDLPLLPLP